VSAGAGVPETGEIALEETASAAEVVEEIAEDAPAGRMLIALDVDGTVILEDESFSPGVVEAIADAQRAGHEVMLATGRSWSTTLPILERLGIRPEYAVCSNGAVVMRRIGEGDTAPYERAHVETFDATEVLSMLHEHIGDARYMVELADGSRLYTEHMDDWNLHEGGQVAFSELSREPVCRVVVVSPDHSDDDFVELVDRIGLTHVSYAIGWTAWLDIAPHGVNKATGLELVREWLGIEPARVLVMGDGRNDIEMFQWAVAHGGRAIAMRQGPPEVHAAAGEVGLSVTEGGVAAVLRAL
jgi:5-amino-6-(5-phospho-D-ribitylamino)uracil phosphatase